jgi:hypothetical protein
MKHLLFFALSVFFVSNKVCGQTDAAVTRIELSKITRGYQEQVLATPDSIHVFLDNSMSGQPPYKRARKLEPGEWTRLVEAVKAVPLKEIPTLPSPTMKRAHDAAKHSTLTITTRDGKDYSHGFDDDDANKALQPLMKELRALSGPLGKP